MQIGNTSISKYNIEDNSLNIDNINVNTNTVGQYTVIYNADDDYGFSADEVTRTVHVINKPIIVLEGDYEVYHEVNTDYTDSGATTTDHYGMNTTSDIKIFNSENNEIVVGPREKLGKKSISLINLNCFISNLFEVLLIIFIFWISFLANSSSKYRLWNSSNFSAELR